MTDDIVTRLRDVTEMNWNGDEVTEPLCGEAADEIEQLRAAGDALYDALLSADMPAHDYVRVIDAWEEARRG